MMITIIIIIFITITIIFEQESGFICRDFAEIGPSNKNIIPTFNGYANSASL